MKLGRFSCIRVGYIWLNREFQYICFWYHIVHVVVGSGCWGRARPPMRPVWPYLTPAQTALYFGNQNPPKKTIYVWPYINHSQAKPDFNTKKLISGLLHDRVRLDKSFPMGPCSTSGDKNSLRYDLGPHHCDCHVSTQ
jgi:hypothetical protein